MLSQRISSTVILDHKNRILLDWSAKAGSVVMIKMFFRHMNLLEDALAYHHWVHNYCSWYCKNNPVTKKILFSNTYLKLKAVRNPYVRAVSSYIQMVKHHVPDALMDKYFKTDRENISFEDFLQYLHSLGKLTDGEFHYHPQRKDFEGKNDFDFDALIRIESASEDIQEINATHSFQFDLANISSGHHIEKTNDAFFCGELPWKSLLDSVPAYHNFYTLSSIQSVYDLYRDDVLCYGYPSDPAEALESVIEDHHQRQAV